MAALVETASIRPSQIAIRTPRVLLVTQASGGGVGRHFLDLAAGLNSRGVEVVGIYSPRKLDTACRSRLAAGGFPPLHQFPMRRAVHPLDGIDTWRLVRFIRSLGRFDIVHGHSSKGGALARLAARWLSIPSVYTPNAFATQDRGLPGWQRSFYGQVERWLARRTDAIIAVSHDEADHAREHLRIDAHKLHVIPNGIDAIDFPSREEARSRLGLADDEFAIGFVGRLAPQKAPDVMLRAFATVARAHRKARLVMVGNGPLEKETALLAEQLGLGNAVRLLGDVVATQVMPAFDVFCLSSRYEGLPYVLLEALAAGLPIVSTRVEGASMCITPNENGLLTPIDDPPALAAALLFVIQNDALRRQFAAASARRVDRFTCRQMVDDVLSVYHRVLSQPKR
jgi:glycosyltransferase involved in cell wall biosynthesis